MFSCLFIILIFCNEIDGRVTRRASAKTGCSVSYTPESALYWRSVGMDIPDSAVDRSRVRNLSNFFTLNLTQKIFTSQKSKLSSNSPNIKLEKIGILAKIGISYFYNFRKKWVGDVYQLENSLIQIYKPRVFLSYKRVF